jgi:predicted ATP-dependent serine protease
LFNLIDALNQSNGAGDPIPPIWRQWVDHGIELRRGSLHLFAAGPGVGKSVAALTIALKSGVPTLYQCADTDAFTTTTRMASALTHKPLTEVQAAFSANEAQDYKNLIKQVTHIRWDFNGQPTVEDVYNNAEAFAHMYGEYPHLIIVDNLSNVFSDEDDMSALRHISEQLNLLARETQSAVITLHHLTGEYESGDVPPPLGALIGKVSKIPAVILNLFRATSGDMGFCIVKNRFGNAMANGKLRAYVPMELTTMSLG